MNVHPFVQVTAIVWAFASLAAIATKKPDPISWAGIVTVCVGIGYFIAHHKP